MPGCARQLLKQFAGAFEIVGEQEFESVEPDHVLRGVPEYFGDGRARVDAVAVAVKDDNEVR
jgi:hypothetical protein